MDFTTEKAGIFIPRQTCNHPDDKKAVKLYGYRRADLPIDRWIDCHQAGYVFVPGDMRSFPRHVNGREVQTFSHQEALWYGTDWIVLDLDHDDIDTHDAGSLQLVDQNVEDLLYAACESLSSNVDGRYARWHGFIVLENPITTREEYTALLIGLSQNIWTMTGMNRQPAQPVYGNARDDAYHLLLENVLTDEKTRELIELGYEINPAYRTQRKQARDRKPGEYVGSISADLLKDYSEIKPERLRQFLMDYQVPLYASNKVKGESTIYYLPCPFRSEHTIDGTSTETYITVNDDKYTFGCFHDHCKNRFEEEKKKGRSRWKVFKEVMSCPIRMGLKRIGITPSQIRHEETARIYDNITCPRDNSHRGTALYRKSDGQCVFLCNSEGCEPVQWREYLDIHLTQGVAA